MLSPTDILRDTERRRLRALVEADGAVLDALHAEEFVLVHPSGGVWSRDYYLGGVLSGEIGYRRFEPVSAIEAMIDGGLAVIRYRSMIDIHVRGRSAGELSCWHMDTFRRADPEAPWRAVWSQATEIAA